MFDVFEAFINTDNIQVFANAATDYIMCLLKFVKGLGGSGFFNLFIFPDLQDLFLMESESCVCLFHVFVQSSWD